MIFLLFIVTVCGAVTGPAERVEAHKFQLIAGTGATTGFIAEVRESAALSSDPDVFSSLEDAQ